MCVYELIFASLDELQCSEIFVAHCNISFPLEHGILVLLRMTTNVSEKAYFFFNPIYRDPFIMPFSPSLCRTESSLPIPAVVMTLL